MLGKRAPRTDHRTLKLARYLGLPAPPVSANWDRKVASWPMMLNDTLGDCVCAAAGHMVEQWSEYAGSEVVLPDSAIESMYEQVGGYVPGQAATDNGCDMLTALNWWRKTGLSGHKIQAFASLNPSFQAQVKSSVYLFGNVYLGLALPATAQHQKTWEVCGDGASGDAAPGSWGGHCVPIVAYNSQTLTVITWGEKMEMTWPFLLAYADEAYAVLSPDWSNSKGVAANNFNLTQLQNDLSEVTA